MVIATLHDDLWFHVSNLSQNGHRNAKAMAKLRKTVPSLGRTPLSSDEKVARDIVHVALKEKASKPNRLSTLQMQSLVSATGLCNALELSRGAETNVLKDALMTLDPSLISKESFCNPGSYLQMHRSSEKSRNTTLRCLPIVAPSTAFQVGKSVLATLGGWDAYDARVKRAKEKEAKAAYEKAKAELEKTLHFHREAESRLCKEAEDHRRLAAERDEEIERDAKAEAAKAEAAERGLEELQRAEATRPKIWKAPSKRKRA